MDHPKDQEDRWGELAALLGLPPEKSTAKAAPAPVPPPAPAPVPEPKVELPEPPAPEPEPVEIETPRMEPIGEETGANWEAEFEGDDDDTTVDEAGQPVDEALTDEEPATEPGAAPPLGEDGQPRRGRRRRRRGRRRGKEGAEGEPRAGEAPSEAPVEAREPAQLAPRPERPPQRDRDGDSRDNRGRGRGRGRREDEQPRRASPPPPPPPRREEPEYVDDEVVSDQPGRVDVPFVAEDTDFSNWNVPSWQELISGLHRPDR